MAGNILFYSLMNPYESLMLQNECIFSNNYILRRRGNAINESLDSGGRNCFLLVSSYEFGCRMSTLYMHLAFISQPLPNIFPKVI